MFQLQELKTRKTLTIKALLYLTAILSVIAVFSHIFFPTTNDSVIYYRVEHRTIKAERDLKFKELNLIHEKFVSGKLSESEFNKQNKAILSEYLSLYKQSKEKYSELNKAKKNATVFHFKNMNVFLYQTSVFVVMLILSILFNYTIKFVKNKALKKAYRFSSFVFLTIAFYYIVWVFYPKSDLPYYSYIIVMLLIAIFLSMITVNLIKWITERESIISIYKENFKRLWYFIINKTPHFVSDEKMDQFVEGYTKEIKEFKIPKHE